MWTNCLQQFPLKILSNFSINNKIQRGISHHCLERGACGRGGESGRGVCYLYLTCHIYLRTEFDWLETTTTATTREKSVRLPPPPLLICLAKKKKIFYSFFGSPIKTAKSERGEREREDDNMRWSAASPSNFFIILVVVATVVIVNDERTEVTWNWWPKRHTKQGRRAVREGRGRGGTIADHTMGTIVNTTLGNAIIIIIMFTMFIILFLFIIFVLTLGADYRLESILNGSDISTNTHTPRTLASTATHMQQCLSHTISNLSHCTSSKNMSQMFSFLYVLEVYDENGL